MTMTLSRRQMLAAACAAVGVGAVRGPASAATEPVRLRCQSRILDIKGKAAKVYGVHQPNGTSGLTLAAGEDFAVRVENALAEPTLLHWHGLTPPWRQDGVPGLTQPALNPGESFDYRFAVAQPGTFWMHSHNGLQEQMLLAAPLIVEDPTDSAVDEQQVVVMLHDFSFTPPSERLTSLGAGGHDMSMHSMAGHAGMDMPAHNPNDLQFDAFLANDRTLDDPQIVAVERGGRVRLRIINAAAATNFTVDLGDTEGLLVAVDGVPVVPMAVRQVPLAIAQRVDIRLTVGAGAVPVLFLREAALERTGIVLAPTGSAVAKLPSESHHMNPLVGTALEERLQAVVPLPQKPVDRWIPLGLVGDMAAYRWGIDGADALMVRAGERVGVRFDNQTPMAHPMHLHGHRFQVVAVNGAAVAGGVRDTVLVPANGSVSIVFDADNAGLWAFHCHHLYHMAAGMMAVLRYDGVS
jgi:FtsP/CotA-like multicopper oxidase with cupredoxin domain